MQAGCSVSCTFIPNESQRQTRSDLIGGYDGPDGHPRTLDAIARVYGLTRERIRQIEATTMTKLRQPFRSQVLRDYLN